MIEKKGEPPGVEMGAGTFWWPRGNVRKVKSRRAEAEGAARVPQGTRVPGKSREETRWAYKGACINLLHKLTFFLWLLLLLLLSCFSRVQLLATPWTAAPQAPLSMGFSSQEYWSGVPLPSPFLWQWPFYYIHSYIILYCLQKFTFFL